MRGKDLLILNLIIIGCLLFASLIGVACAYIHINYGLVWALFTLALLVFLTINIVALITGDERERDAK